MESHGVTCHPAEVEIPPLPPAEAGTRRVEADEFGDVRRTTLSGDLVHENCDFELDAVLHW